MPSNLRVKSYSADTFVAKLNYLFNKGVVTDAGIAAITNSGTVAKFRTYILALTGNSPGTRLVLQQMADDIDRCSSTGLETLTNAVVDAARDAGSDNFATLISGITAISGTPANTQPYSTWS